jgi:hypothetical protein
MKNALKHIALLVTLLLSFFSLSAMAQETTATVNGQITDSAGAVISGAEITLTHLATKEVRTVKSNEEGYYSLPLIKPGLYDLSVKLTGFKEYINKGVELLVNDRKTLNIALEPGQVTESVTVTAETPIVQSTPTVGDVIDSKKVLEIPLNNRNFLQLITLIPGVTADDTAEAGVDSRVMFDPTSTLDTPSTR